MKESKIEWTDATWNPWQGCIKVSAGCKWCYMYREKQRYGQDPRAIVRSKPATFNAPLRWKEPRRVFTCSWSDFFIDQADPWRDEAWDIIRKTPHLTYQILTKRPENIRDRLPFDWGDGWPNVWLGISAENQDAFDKRIYDLLDIPAKIWFVSLEPLLGPIDMFYIVPIIDFLHWIIVGGESGPNARPMHPDWARSIRDQCVEAGVPFFFKQWGEWYPTGDQELDNHARWIGDGPKPPMEVVWGTQECGYYCDPDADLHPDHQQWIMKRIGKKVAGRLLDGREWNQFPRSEQILIQAELVLK